MELIHVATNFAHRGSVVDGSNECTIAEFLDGDTVMVTASLRSQFLNGVGVWLRVGSDYPAQLAARDVATLSHLIPLRHVVVEARFDVELHSDVLRALLTDDEVTFANGVATLRSAFNRPAPPSPVMVWSFGSDSLTSAERVLRRGRTQISATCERTVYS
jgi:hypothetical protein